MTHEATPKFCRDCVWCRPEHKHMFGELGSHDWDDYTSARCALTDHVVGDGSAGRLCADERGDGKCGPEALRFDPKMPPANATQPTKPTAKRWWLP